jgi:hypothetical protein
MAKKIEISKEGYLELISQVYVNKLEEREMALDRYRKADEQMETSEQFILMSKGAVAFLNLASMSSNELAALAKEVKGIVYKDSDSPDIQLNLTEEFKSQISEHIEDLERASQRKLVDEPEETVSPKKDSDPK